MPRKLTDAARAAMSAGAKKARSMSWGETRPPRAQLSIDADVAERFCSIVHPRDRRRIATDAIAQATTSYVLRHPANAPGPI